MSQPLPRSALSKIPGAETVITAMRAMRSGLAAEIRQLRRMKSQSYQYLFIITYGRSGSTLLSGVLNSIPGYLIRGENENYLYGLFRSHTAAVAWKQKFMEIEPLPPEHAWYGIDGYNVPAALWLMRQLVLNTLLRPKDDSRVLGFKEIRYDQEDLIPYLEFIRTLFPGARFIFNSRNLADVQKSQWWATEEPEVLQEFQVKLDEAEKVYADVSFHVHYDDYKENPKQLRALFEFLGESLDIERVSAVLGRRHSY